MAKTSVEPLQTEDHFLSELEQINYPGGKNGFWYAACGCEKYASDFWPYPDEAVKQLNKHIRTLTEED